MTYASVADMRAEGVTTADADDARLTALLADATSIIDAACGWWFEPRTVSFTLSGRGTKFLDTQVPPISITTLELDGVALAVTAPDLLIVGSLLESPKRTIKHTTTFTKGRDNVLVSGSFGWVETVGNQLLPPAAIRRACIMLAVGWIPKLATAEASEAQFRSRIVEERTRDQSYKLSEPSSSTSSSSSLTGNQVVDDLLVRYMRPPQFGAA